MELSLLRDRGSSPCKPADQQGWLMKWERTKLTGHWWHSLEAHLQAGHAGVLTTGNDLLAGHCWHSFHAHLHASPQQTVGTRLNLTGPVHNPHWSHSTNMEEQRQTFWTTITIQACTGGRTAGRLAPTHQQAQERW